MTNPVKKMCERMSEAELAEKNLNLEKAYKDLGFIITDNPWEDKFVDPRPLANQGANSVEDRPCDICGEDAKWSMHFYPSTPAHRLIGEDIKNDHADVCNDVRCHISLRNIGFVACGCGG